MISKIFSVSESIGYQQPILIETSVSDKGLPVFEIYGLVSKSIEESKKRIITSFESSGIDFPLKNIKVNIAPANISKDGTHFDLTIAYLILESKLTHRIPENSCLLGELSFDGSISKLDNIFYLCLSAIEQGIKNIFIPFSNTSQVQGLNGVNIFPVKHLTDLLRINLLEKVGNSYTPENDRGNDTRDGLIFRSIRGNEVGKKIIQYSLIGKHHFLLEGFPGVGKSMLVKSMSDIAPNLDRNSALEVAKVLSYTGNIEERFNFYQMPIRSPHQSSSYSAVLGSFGNKIYPGEVALSNHGILFLDEMPEFNRLVLEGLRGPLEDKKISISRLKNKVVFNTDFILACTRNPCRCGYFDHPKIPCNCSPFEVRKYQNRISGPIIDRIDMYFKLMSNQNELNTEKDVFYSFEEYTNIKKRVRLLRQERNNFFQKRAGDTSFKNSDENILFSNLSLKSKSLISNVKNNYSISNRGLYKILNLALTIAIFNNREEISESDILESLSFRYTNSS